MVDYKSNGPLPIHTAQGPPVAPGPIADAPIAGPSLGPSAGDAQDFALPEADDVDDAPPRSPYSANAALRRELTMPSVPNFDIPPSPEAPAPEATEKKFAHFLKLKSQGVHFHDRLLASSAFHNPSLMEELMEFAGISEADQYATTLPKWAADPTGYPKWAYKDELAKSQDKERKRREQDALGKPRDFVAAAAQGEASSAGTTPSLGAKSNDEARPAQMAGQKRKSRFDA